MLASVFILCTLKHAAQLYMCNLDIIVTSLCEAESGVFARLGQQKPLGNSHMLPAAV